MNRTIAFLVVGLIFSLIFSGCLKLQNTSSEEKVVLRVAWWGKQNRHDLTNNAIALFKKKHPNIEIQVDYCSWEGYYNKILLKSASDSLPDLFQCGIKDKEMSSIITQNMLCDLSSYAKDKTLDLSDCPVNLLDAGIIKEKLLAIPFGFGKSIMVVDPQIFEAAGVEMWEKGYNYDQFEKDLIQIRERTGKYGIVSLKPFWFFERWYVRSLGQKMYNDEGTGLGFSEKTLADCFRMVLRIQEKGAVPTLEMESQIKDIEDSPFIKGEAACEIITTSSYNQYVKMANRPIKLAYKPNDTLASEQLGAGVMFAVSSNSSHKKDAVRLLNFFLNDSDAVIAMQGERGIPLPGKMPSTGPSILNHLNTSFFSILYFIPSLTSPILNVILAVEFPTMFI